MNLRALVGGGAISLAAMTLLGCGPKPTSQAIAPIVEAPPTDLSSPLSAAATINGQATPDAALDEQKKYQKMLVGDARLRAKQKAICKGQETESAFLDPPLRRPCQALAYAESDLEVSALQHPNITNRNSL
ncbi:MAG: hypothetical protein ACYDD1_12255 [Caulobacteraceae bacterium]